MIETECPACGHHVALPFFDGGRMPLSTLAWPVSSHEACAMSRLPLAFVRCVDCGHIYNRDFDYKKIPYSDSPNRMFNRGTFWEQHLLNLRALILERVPPAALIVEVGCGDGHLLRALKQARPDARVVGFDPNGSVDTDAGQVEAYQDLFSPARHLEALRPHFLIMRHVLEHLTEPLAFVQALAFACEWLELDCQLLVEVPCIDRALETCRTADFYYEHNSHFSSASFQRLLERASVDLEYIAHAYGEEVIVGIGRLGKRRDRATDARKALRFREDALATKSQLTSQLDALHASGKRIAIWGGTGKAATFINYYGLDKERFPLVIDSDRDKAGSFVPGSGQPIHFRDHLLEHPAEVILIPTHWRAREIADEITRVGISYETILLEHQGQLVDFDNDPHPYKPQAPAPRPLSPHTSPESDASPRPASREATTSAR